MGEDAEEAATKAVERGLGGAAPILQEELYEILAQMMFLITKTRWEDDGMLRWRRRGVGDLDGGYEGAFVSCSLCHYQCSLCHYGYRRGQGACTVPVTNERQKGCGGSRSGSFGIRIHAPVDSWGCRTTRTKEKIDCRGRDEAGGAEDKSPLECSAEVPRCRSFFLAPQGQISVEEERLSL